MPEREGSEMTKFVIVLNYKQQLSEADNSALGNLEGSLEF